MSVERLRVRVDQVQVGDVLVAYAGSRRRQRVSEIIDSPHLTVAVGIVIAEVWGETKLFLSPDLIVPIERAPGREISRVHATERGKNDEEAYEVRSGRAHFGWFDDEEAAWDVAVANGADVFDWATGEYV